MLRKLDHVGIAVAEPKGLTALFRALLGLVYTGVEEIPHEMVTAHFLDAGPVKLELLEASDPDSPVAKFLRSRKGSLHHLAFEVSDIDKEMARVKQLGFAPLSLAPVRGAAGKRIFFLHPKDTGGVLVEFCQPEDALPELAPVALVSTDACLSIGTSLARHAPQCTGATIASVQEQIRRMSWKSVHLIVQGGDAESALEFARASATTCLSVSLHSTDRADVPSAPVAPVPLLISAPDTQARQAWRLHHSMAGSRLCILPATNRCRSGVNPKALVSVLLAHLTSAQK